MHIAFVAAGLREYLPFNDDEIHYTSEQKRHECHINPARVSWISRYTSSQGKSETSAEQPSLQTATVLAHMPKTTNSVLALLSRWIAYGRSVQAAGGELPGDLIDESKTILAANAQQGDK